MNIKTKITFFFLSIVGSFYFFSKMKNSKKIKDDNTIIVGTSADYEPYAFINLQTNEIVGFDVDIARAVVESLGKKIVIKNIPFSSLIFDLLSGHIDLIASAITPTEQRSKKVLFSNKYLIADPLVILTKEKDSKIENINDLMGKTVAVNIGYTADMFLSNKVGIHLIKLKSPAEAFLALQSGSVDAFVCAKSSLVRFLEKKDLANLYKITVLQETGDDYAFAINKQNIELANHVNQALRKIEQDGILKKLKQKWGLE